MFSKMRLAAGTLVLFAATLLVAAPHLFAIAPRDIAAPNGSISFTDRSGIPLGTVLSASGTRSVAVPASGVAPVFFAAIVAAEDGRFYRHGAVDWLSLGRALVAAARCLCNAGGASTIPMQLARLRYDLPAGIRGKLRQVWLAERISAGSDKNAILEAYVNRVPMGGNIYGVEAAAREYFGTPARDLDLAQAALLAGIPKDPDGLSPLRFWSAARARQRYVLSRMVEAGEITPGDAATAAREPLALRLHPGGVIAAQHLLFRLAQTVRLASGPIRTTIDLDLQRFVQAQARDVVTALASRNVTQAAALVVDNVSGEVLAYAGSLDYFDDAYLGRNDGVQALRQPGSTLKPFLYELALERRSIRPYTILADAPATYAVPEGGLYSPEDYDRRFAGPVPVREALANSLNVPAVRVLAGVGVPAFLDRLRDLGFAHLRKSPDYYGLGLTLGAGEVSLWDLAHAYVTLARGGDAIALRTLESAPPSPARPIGDRASWQLVADMLSDRYARARAFGVGSVIDMPFPALVKTGTSSGYRDTWAVGGTPQYTVAVWVGNFSGAPMQHIAGVSGAGPLWNRILLHLYDRRDPPRFPAPQGYRLVRIAPETSEYLDAADRKAFRIHSPAQLAKDPAYDEWRVRNDRTTGPLRILVPHDGDAFEDRLDPQDPRRSQQAIAFRVSRPAHSQLVWKLNGSVIARGSDDAYYWPVRVGTWSLDVADGRSVSSVAFTVVARRPGIRRGFAVIGN